MTDELRQSAEVLTKVAHLSRARMMRFSFNYHQDKAAIMKPISKCNASMDHRTGEAVRAAEIFCGSLV